MIPGITKAAFAHYARPEAPKADMFSGTVLQEKAEV
jgi:hypothetical protein